MLTPPNPRPPRSGWDHPVLAHYLERSAPNGPIAAGGGMAAATLVGAYRQGVFPWPSDDPDDAAELREALGAAVARGIIPAIPSPEVLATPDGPVRSDAVGNDAVGNDAVGNDAELLDPPWFCPDPRTVLAPGTMRLRRSLVTRMRRSTWTSTIDTCFVDVVRACRRDGPYQWITEDLVEGFAELHDLGWAHSIEVWDDDQLVGGMYGVLVGRVFMGESMFHRATDASKVALADFLERFGQAGGRLLDAQINSTHLTSLGAREIPRAEFLATLRAVRDDEVRLERDRLPVSRLAPARGPDPARARPAGRRTGVPRAPGT